MAGQSFIIVHPVHNLILQNDVYIAFYMDLNKARKRNGRLPLGTFYVLHVISELLACPCECVRVRVARITFELIQ
jgi:hypothetical protein